MRTFRILVNLVSIGSALAYERTNVNVSHPESNANLNTTLAYYKLAGYNGNDDFLTHGFVPTSCGANLSAHYTDPCVWGNQTGTTSRPILILTHGYPESSYIWRYVAGAVSARTPVFIPDQPGYGLSSSCCNATDCAYDKRTQSRAILEAVKKIYGNVHVIYAGHDRGARITGLGFFVADIVPYIAEFASFANPFWAQNYFHWAFLPKGASIDYDTQLWDQGNDTKVSIPTHVMYSIYNLGSAFDVLDVWRNYTHPSAGVTVQGVGEGKGHFIIEEAPDETIEQLNAFMDRLGVETEASAPIAPTSIWTLFSWSQNLETKSFDEELA
nr:fluoroacetate dehalogenase [Quercus suber]